MASGRLYSVKGRRLGLGFVRASMRGWSGDGEGEAGDDDIGEGFAGDVDAAPEALGAEEDVALVFLL
jgi:hypothetical protein